MALSPKLSPLCCTRWFSLLSLRMELRSFRPTAFGNTLVDSPMTYNILQEDENTFRDVILVTLGFHMCSHCLSMLIPFFRLAKRQIRFGRIDLVWAKCYWEKRPDTIESSPSPLTLLNRQGEGIFQSVTRLRV